MRINIPDYAIATANEYVIERVGEENFRDNVVYNEEETIRLNSVKHPNSQYKIAYNYKPMEILNNDPNDSRFTVTIADKNSEYYKAHKRREGINRKEIPPNCMSNPETCEFYITGEKAKEIAYANGFSLKEPKVHWKRTDGKLYIRVFQLRVRENEDECSYSEAMYINYITGEVENFEKRDLCGDPSWAI